MKLPRFLNLQAFPSLSGFLYLPETFRKGSKERSLNTFFQGISQFLWYQVFCQRSSRRWYCRRGSSYPCSRQKTSIGQSMENWNWWHSSISLLLIWYRVQDRWSSIHRKSATWTTLSYLLHTSKLMHFFSFLYNI